MSATFETRAHGKLLLTGEYFVLDGAVALAMPVRFGQKLRAAAGKESGILEWNSLDETGQVWFKVRFSLPDLEIMETGDRETAQTLQSILLACRKQNPAFLGGQEGIEVRTQTDFPRDWGLGTSSTLLAALGRWAEANPYRILADTLGGSGYDLACAYADGPVLYQWSKTRPVIQPIHFQPVFSENIYFVYLGKKQNSREGIQRYRDLTSALKPAITQIDRLTERCLTASSLAEFQQVLEEHEALVSHTLELPTVKSQFFEDFPGAVKSLGAWGGDFVMAASSLPEPEIRGYFGRKGFGMVLSWAEMMAPD